MTTRVCDFCGQPIAGHAAILHVPMATPSAHSANTWFVGHGQTYHSVDHRQYDVCLGCIRGLLRMTPHERRALDETERVAKGA